MTFKYYVYIVTNKKRGVLYIGMTNDIERRYFEHSKKLNESFTKKYNLDKLVLVEEYSDVNDAIFREKQLKNWKREWEIQLIENVNFDWENYFE